MNQIKVTERYIKQIHIFDFVYILSQMYYFYSLHPNILTKNHSFTIIILYLQQFYSQYLPPRVHTKSLRYFHLFDFTQPHKPYLPTLKQFLFNNRLYESLRHIPRYLTLSTSCACPQHHWCLPSARYVRSINTIIEYGKKESKRI